MSEKHARKHQNISNRASSKQSIERRVVYKTVLDNPFQIPWPQVPMNIQNMLLARLLSILENAPDIQRSRQRGSQSLKRAGNQPDNNQSKRRRRDEHVQSDTLTDGNVTGRSAISILTDAPSMAEIASNPPAPYASTGLSQHLSIGINEVTKLLEGLSQKYRLRLSSGGDSDLVQSPPTEPTQLVLVCQADINPPILISHLPQLVAACNSRPSLPSELAKSKIILSPLPKGAESLLAQSLGLRRASVVSISSDAPQFSAFDDLLLGSIPLLRSPWLTGPNVPRNPGLEPTHIKQLKTTAPKSMKEAKDSRTEGKAMARKRKFGLEQLRSSHCSGSGSTNRKVKVLPPI